MFLIKIELERVYPLPSWPPRRHWFRWIPWGCLSWICLFWSWGIWYELHWRGIPWNWITYRNWGFTGSMYKVLLYWIIRPLFLLNWYHGVSLGFLMTFEFQICSLQPFISKVRDIVLIIICTIEGLKCYQLWPHQKLLIFSCMHSLKIVIKHQIKLSADVASL